MCDGGVCGRGVCDGSVRGVGGEERPMGLIIFSTSQLKELGSKEVAPVCAQTATARCINCKLAANSSMRMLIACTMFYVPWPSAGWLWWSCIKRLHVM